MRNKQTQLGLVALETRPVVERPVRLCAQRIHSLINFLFWTSLGQEMLSADPSQVPYTPSPIAIAIKLTVEVAATALLKTAASAPSLCADASSADG